MITKAIIKAIPELNGNIYRVYIPLLRNANDEEIDATFNATLAYTKGIVNSLNVNDVVFVSFEDSLYSKPVIIGSLYKGGIEDNVTTQALLKTLTVSEKVSAGNTLLITGGVTTKDNTESIYGLREDLTSKTDSINESIDEIRNTVDSMVETIAEGAITSIDRRVANEYDLIVVYGYKENAPAPNQTCFVFMPSQLNTQTNFQIEQASGNSPSIWNYRIRLNVGGDGRIYWFSDLDYSGSAVFIGTKVIGIRGQ